jgi:hypothetical protein
MIVCKKKGEFKVEMVLQRKRTLLYQRGQGKGEDLLLGRSFLIMRKAKIASKGKSLICQK